MEKWKPIDGYPNSLISNKGRVMSLFRGVRKIRALQEHECGYLTLTLQRKDKTKRMRVHRLVAAAFLGPIPEGLDVNHKDGNKKNNNVENLEFMTRSENCKHGFRLGLSFTPFRVKGENHKLAKLTEAEVLAIRNRYSNGEGCRSIADSYNVSRYTVWDIAKRRTWTHI